MSIPHICESIPPLRVYPHPACLPTTPCVYPPPYVYSTSICLLYIHMSTPHPHVYPTSICLPFIHVSTLHPHVYSISTCPLYIHMSTLQPRVYSTSTCPALHIQSVSNTRWIREWKHFLHLHPHSGCCTAERENCVFFWSIELLVFEYFHLGHCVTRESESEGGFMKIYWQWENVRVYRGIALVCVYTTSLASSAYL